MLDSIRSNTQSWVVKAIFGIIIVVFVFWGMGNMGTGPSGGLAQVNGESITVGEYHRMLERVVTAYMRIDPDVLSDQDFLMILKREVLDEMIDGKVKMQEARRLGITVTPNELKRYLHDMPQFHDDSGRFSEALYRMQLAAAGLTGDQYLHLLADELLIRKLMAYISMSSGISEAEARLEHDFNMEFRSADYVLFSLEEYKAIVQVSDEEIAAYYERNQEAFRRPVRANLEFLRLTPETLAAGYPVSDDEAEAFYQENIEDFHTPAMFQARHIAIAAPPDGSTEPGAADLIATAKARVAEIEARLQAGEDFAELARAYSDDPGTARLGGMLPWYEVMEGDDPLNVAINALEPGQVSAAVRNPGGFHLFRMEERRPSGLVSFDEEKDRIKEFLAIRRADMDFGNAQRAAEDALHLGTSFAELGETLALTLERSGLIAEGELRQLLGVTREYTGVLADAIAEAAASGNPAVIPVPLDISGGIALVRILDATPSMIAPLADVRVDIRSILQEEKGAALALAAAIDALPLFFGQDVPEGFKDRVQRSAKAFRLAESLPPFSNVPELVSALFFTRGGWMPQVFVTPQGPIIAKLGALDPATPEMWAVNNQHNAFVNNYRQWQVSRITGAFEYGLMLRARVQVNERMLASIGWR